MTHILNSRKLLVLALLAWPILGQAQLVFQTTYGGSGADRAESISLTADNGYSFCGNSNSTGAGFADIFVAKLDPLGTPTWGFVYGGTGNEYGERSKETSTGGHIVTARSNSYTPSQGILTMLLDNTGAVVWANVFSGGSAELPQDVIETADGFVVVGNTQSYGQGGKDLLIIKYDFNGNLMWAKTYGGAGNDTGVGVIEDSGDLLVVGQTASFGGGGNDVYIIRTNATGVLQWTLTLGDADNEVAKRIVRTPSGSFGIIANKITSGANSAYLISMEGNGTVNWEKQYTGGMGAGGVTTNDMCAMNSGFGIASTIAIGSGDGEAAILKTDFNGTLQFVSGFGSTGTENGQACAASPDGGAVIAGLTYAFGATLFNPDAHVAKMDANGNLGCFEGVINSVTENNYTGGQSSGGVEATVTTTLTSVNPSVAAFVGTNVQCTTEPDPLAQFTPSDTLICVGSCIDFLDSSLNAVNYSWTINGGTPSSSTNASLSGVCFNTAGTYNVTLTVFNSQGSDSQTHTITVGSQTTLSINATPNAGTVTSNQFQKRYETLGGFQERCESLSKVSDGGYIMSGKVQNYPNGSTFSQYVVKADMFGNLEWTRIHSLESQTGLPIGISDNMISIVEAQDLTGYFGLMNATDITATGYTIGVEKLDYQGDIVWARYYPGLGQIQEGHENIVSTVDGGAIMSFRTDEFGSGMNDMYVLKIDGLGNIEWDKVIGGTGNEWANRTLQTSDGGYLLTGNTTSSGAGMADILLVKLSANGTQEWSMTYGGSGTDKAFQTVELANGNFVVTGWTDSYGAGQDDGFLLETDANGVLQWSSAYGTANDDQLFNLTTSLSGDYVMTGNASADGWLMKVGTGGALTWSRSIGGGSGDNFMGDLVTADDGGYVMSGGTLSFGGSDQDFYLVKTDSNGIAAGCNEGPFAITATGFTPSVAPITLNESNNILQDSVIVPLTLGSTSAVDEYICDSIVTNGGICEGDSIVLTASGASSYVWSTGATSPSITVWPTVSTSYSVTSGGGCGGSASILVVVNPGLNITMSVDTTICEGDTANLVAGGGSTYTWTPAPDLGNPSAANTTAFPTTTTTFQATITDGGCSKDTTVTVTVTPADSAGFTYPTTTYCLNDPDPLATITGTPGGMFSISGGGVIDSNTGEIDLAGSGSGTYTVTYVTPGVCSDNMTMNISISNAFDATITPPAVLCEGDSALTLSAVDPGGTWTGTGITNGSTGEFDPAQAGAGTHQIIYDIPGSCGDADTITITVNSGVVPQINPAGPYCEAALSQTLTASVGGGVWSGPGITDTVNGTFDPLAAGTGTFDIYYSVAGGCGGEDTLTVTVNPTPIADAGLDTTITVGESVNLSGSGGTTYSWSPPTGLSCTNCPNPIASPTVTTDYCVTVVDGNGCSDSNCLRVTVLDVSCVDLFIPNAFSPNADGHNDEFCVYGNCFETMQILVFNRLGELVFEGNETNNCWSGTFRGQLLNSGVFVYRFSGVKTDGSTVKENGNVSLIR